MNIYKTTTFGEQEITVNLEIDSEKKTDVELARELLDINPKQSSTTGIFVQDVTLDSINSVENLLNAIKNKKGLGISKFSCI